MLDELLFVGPCTGKSLDGERFCSCFSLLTVVADSLFEPFVASEEIIKDFLDESSLLFPDAWLLCLLIFVGPCIGQPLDGERLCSRVSLVTVIADSLFEPFAASGEIIKDSLDDSSLLLPDAWVLGALLFLGPCTEQPLDGERLCSRFSLVTVVADSPFKPLAASGKVIKDSLDESSLLSPDAWVLSAPLFVGPSTGQPLDGKIFCSCFCLLTVVADSLFEPFVASGDVIKESLDESSLLLPDAWALCALLFVGPCTRQLLDGEKLCFRVSLVTVVADSLFEPFVASGEVIKDSLDESSLLLPDAWVLCALLFVGPCTGQPLDGERLCSRFSLVTILADSPFEPFVASGKVTVFVLEIFFLFREALGLSPFFFPGPCTEQPLDRETLCSRFSLVTVFARSLFEPFVASGKVIKDSTDESSLLFSDAWVVGELLFVGPSIGQPLDGERLCSRVSFVTVVADSVFEPFVPSGEIIKDSLDDSFLLLPDAWVLGALLFLGPCTEQPLDGERLCSRFSLVTVVADSPFKPLVASGKVIKDSLDESSLLSPDAWVLSAPLFVGPSTGQPLDGERFCSCFCLLTVVADSLFEPFVASGDVIKDSIDERSLLLPDAWVLCAFLFVGPCTG